MQLHKYIYHQAPSATKHDALPHPKHTQKNCTAFVSICINTTHEVAQVARSCCPRPQVMHICGPLAAASQHMHTPRHARQDRLPPTRLPCLYGVCPHKDPNPLATHTLYTIVWHRRWFCRTYRAVPQAPAAVAAAGLSLVTADLSQQHSSRLQGLANYKCKSCLHTAQVRHNTDQTKTGAHEHLDHHTSTHTPVLWCCWSSPPWAAVMSRLHQTGQ